MINNEDNERYDDTYAAQSDPPTTTTTTTTTPSRFCALPMSLLSSHHHHATNNTHHPAAPRRGGVIFAEEKSGNDDGDISSHPSNNPVTHNGGVKYALQRIKYPEIRSKSILKVKSLDDSLNSPFENGRSHHEKSWRTLSFRRRQQQQHRTTSYRLRVVQTLQNLQIPKAFSKRTGMMEPRDYQNEEDETENDVLTELGEGDDDTTPMSKTSKTSINLMMARQLQEEQELSTRRRGVHFSTVSVRQYHITPDDNPSVSRGPAVGLSWNFDEMPTVALEQYEELMSEVMAASAAAASNCHASKPMEHLRMTFQERLRLLRDIGTPPPEIKRFIRKSNVARMKRLRTIAQLKEHDWQLAKKMSKNKVTKQN